VFDCHAIVLVERGVSIGMEVGCSGFELIESEWLRRSIQQTIDGLLSVGQISCKEIQEFDEIPCLKISKHEDQFVFCRYKVCRLFQVVKIYYTWYKKNLTEKLIGN
jgi:hypothetical protein